MHTFCEGQPAKLLQGQRTLLAFTDQVDGSAGDTVFEPYLHGRRRIAAQTVGAAEVRAFHQRAVEVRENVELDAVHGKGGAVRREIESEEHSARGLSGAGAHRNAFTVFVAITAQKEEISKCP